MGRFRVSLEFGKNRVSPKTIPQKVMSTNPEIIDITIELRFISVSGEASYLQLPSPSEFKSITFPRFERLT